MGCVVAIVFTCFGAAYGTAKAGVGVCTIAVLRPDLIVKSKFTPEWRNSLQRSFAVQDESFSILGNATLIQMWFNRHSSGCDGWHYRDLWLSRLRSCRKRSEAESPLVYRLGPVFYRSLRRPCRLSSWVSCLTNES